MFLNKTGPIYIVFSLSVKLLTRYKVFIWPLYQIIGILIDIFSIRQIVIYLYFKDIESPIAAQLIH